jgi:hypothetical protein
MNAKTTARNFHITIEKVKHQTKLQEQLRDFFFQSDRSAIEG